MQGIIAKCVLAATVAVLTIASAPTAALAAVFDGDWTVTVFTERGKCDRSYSYDVRVVRGMVRYTDYTSVSLSGTVTPQGMVSVNIRHHDDTASGVGHLSEVTGTGDWRGAGKDGACSGHWKAHRR
jgi:hypothetical protein